MKRAEFKQKLTDLLNQPVDGLGKRDKLEYARDILSCGETGDHRPLQAREEVVDGGRVKHSEFEMKDVAQARPDFSLVGEAQTAEASDDNCSRKVMEKAASPNLELTLSSLSLEPMTDQDAWDGIERRNRNDRRTGMDRRARVRFSGGKMSDRRAYRERRQNWPPTA